MTPDHIVFLTPLDYFRVFDAPVSENALYIGESVANTLQRTRNGRCQRFVK